MSAPRPVPHPTPLSAPYWEGARHGRLLLQRCGRCGMVRHYPQLLCRRCQCDEVEWIEATRRGTAHSWTVAHHAFHPAFAEDTPYTLVIADMEEGVRMMGRYVGQTPLRLGLPLRLDFEPDSRDTPVPVFRPAQD